MAAKSVDVRDVCGAGDAVLATIGVAMASGDTLRHACSMALAIGAEQVGKVGISPTGSLESTAEILDCRKRHDAMKP
jgi:bifunctional ADP-heptose synthase (sugar kinase/adenylyltransferase)